MNNQTPSRVLEKFEIVHPVTVVCRKLLMIEVEKVDEFDDQELSITKTIEPDQIIWKNLKHSMSDGGPRIALVNFVALVVAIATMITTIYFSGQIQKLGLNINCKEHDFTEAAAYKRQRQLDMQQAVLNAQAIADGEVPTLKLSENMICYCKDQTNGGSAPWKATNEHFKKIDPAYTDMPNYCKRYFDMVVNQEAVINGNQYVGVIFNSLVAQIFQMLGQFMIVHTTIQEKLASFKYIILLEYFNMGVVFMIEGFDPTGFSTTLLGLDPETQTSAFSGFESGWYMQIGLKLCFTVFMSSVITNINEVKRIA